MNIRHQSRNFSLKLKKSMSTCSLIKCTDLEKVEETREEKKPENAHMTKNYSRNSNSRKSSQKLHSSNSISIVRKDSFIDIPLRKRDSSKKKSFFLTSATKKSSKSRSTNDLFLLKTTPKIKTELKTKSSHLDALQNKINFQRYHLCSQIKEEFALQKQENVRVSREEMQGTLTRLFDSNSFKKHSRTPKKGNNYHNISPRYSMNKKKKIFLKRSCSQSSQKLQEALSKIQQKGLLLGDEIKYRLNEDLKIPPLPKKKIVSDQEFVKGEKEVNELKQDIEEKNPIEEVEHIKKFINLQRQEKTLSLLHSDVAYSLRYYFADKLGFGWNSKLQYKKKDWNKLKTLGKEGRNESPEDHLI